MASNFYWRAADGTHSVALSTTKPTTPALAIDDNGTIKYVGLAAGAGPANGFHAYLSGVSYYATSGVSTDNWTTAAVIFSSSSISGADQHQAASDGNGVIIGVGKQCTNYLLPANYNGHKIISTDHGVTWSHGALDNWSTSNQGSQTSGYAIATNKTGTWIMAGQKEDGSDYQCQYSISTNNGASWTSPMVMPGWPLSGTSYSSGSCPTAMAYGNGVWVIVGRRENAVQWFSGGNGYYSYTWAAISAISTNNGASWTCPTLWASDNPVAGGLTYDVAYDVETDGNGTWIAVGTHAGPGSTTSTAVFSRSTNNGASWSAHAALWAGGATNPYYHCGKGIATDGAGTWVAIGSQYVSSSITTLQVVTYSTDNGVTWSSPVAIPNAPTNGKPYSANSITFARGQFLIVGTGQTGSFCSVSSDGISWTSKDLPGWNARATYGPTCVVFSGAKWVVIGDQSGGGFSDNALAQTSS